MPGSLPRRAVLLPALLVAVGAVAGCAEAPAPAEPSVSPSAETSPAPFDQGPVDRALAALEAEFDARVGIAAVDLASGDSIAYRADERFGFASTIKVLTAAALLHVTADEELDVLVTWSEDAVVAHSPVTEGRGTEGMTLRDLAEAVVRTSDNTALNLVLGHLGGPGALETELRVLGDEVTSVDRDEPGLNEVVLPDPRDTTTPRAFCADLRAYLADGVLDPGDREQLLDWMAGNQTGDRLIRASVPSDWTIFDKSGGAGAMRNDVALVRRPAGGDVIVVILTERNDPLLPYEDAVVARAAAVVLEGLEQRP